MFGCALVRLLFALWWLVLWSFVVSGDLWICCCFVCLLVVERVVLVFACLFALAVWGLV